MPGFLLLFSRIKTDYR